MTKKKPCTPEMEQQKAFEQFLQEKGVHTLSSYTGPLKSRSKASMLPLLREMGALGADCGSLFQLRSVQADALAEWWQENRETREWGPGNGRRSMDYWAEFRTGAVQEPVETAAVEEFRRALALPHCLSLSLLLTGFCWGSTDIEQDQLSLLEYLGAVNGHRRSNLDKVLRGERNGFPELWHELWDHLTEGTERELPEELDLLEGCEKLLKLIGSRAYLSVCGQLLRTGETDFDTSLAGAVCRLDRAVKQVRREKRPDQTALIQPFFDLVVGILREYRPQEPQSGEQSCVCTRQFWEENFLWESLERGWNPGVFGLYHELLDEFLNGLDPADESNQTPEDREVFCRAARFYLRLTEQKCCPPEEAWKQLRTCVPALKEHWTPLSDRRRSCDIDYREVLVQQKLAETLLLDSGREVSGPELLKLRRGLERSAEMLLEKGRIWAVLEQGAVRENSVNPLWAKVELCRAVCLRQLTEREAACGQVYALDLEQEVLASCRAALSTAEIRGKTLPMRWETALHREIRRCCRCFFSRSDVTRNLYGTEEERQAYLEELELWRSRWPEDFANLNKVQAPVVLVPELPVFCGEPILSQVLDSVRIPSGAGKNRRMDYQQRAECTLFQLCLSGNTVLTQPNMICDNPAMLRLADEPGFLWACRRGMIALSPYQGNETPLDYVLNNLQKDGFSWSSTRLYSGPDGPRHRTMMRQYLLHQIPASAFPRDVRDEMSQLAERYLRLNEAFRKSDLLWYHQDPAKALRPRKAARKKSMAEVLQDRLRTLQQDAQNDPERLLRLESAGERVRSWGELNSRSAFYRKIQEARGAGDPAELDRCRELVDQAYLMSNLQGVCDQVQLSTDDANLDLICTEECGSCPQYQLSRTRTQDSPDVNWKGIDDIMERCLLVAEEERRMKREEELQTAGKWSYLETQRELAVRKLESSTGQKYICFGSDLVANSFVAETSDRQVVQIAESAEGAAHKEYIEHTTREG